MPRRRPSSFRRRSLHLLWPRSIRGKVILLVVIALLPLMIMESFYGIRHYHWARDRELDSDMELAEAVSLAFYHFAQNIWSTGAALGNAIFLDGESLSPDDAERLMRMQLAFHPAVSGFSWVDPGGSVVATTEPGFRTSNHSAHPYYQRIISGENRVLSNLSEDPVTHRTFFALATAIRREGALLGILVTQVRAKALHSVLPVDRSGAQSTGLVDGAGRLVYRSNEPNLPFARRQLHLDKENAGPASTKSRFYAAVAGDYRMAAAVPIPEMGWVAYATTSIEEEVAAFRQNTWRSLAWIGLVLFITVGGAFAVADDLLVRYGALQRAAAQWSEARFDVRAHVQGKDELAATSEVFNQMAERLQRLEQERQEFMNITVHEIGNPLSNVKLTVQLLRLKVSMGTNVDEIDQKLGVIERQVDVAASILADRFAVMRGEVETRLADPNGMELSSAVRTVGKAFQSTADHVILLDVEPKAVWIRSNPSQIKRVLNDIVEYVLARTPDWEDVYIGLKAQCNRAVVWVRAGGQARGLEKVRYSQGTAPIPGLESGLSATWTLVRNNGGRMWIEKEDSNSGPELTVFIDLPVDKGQMSSA